MDVHWMSLTVQGWGGIRLGRVIPRGGSPWGSFQALEGTPIGDLIPVVTGEVFSHAMYGHTRPLQQVLGPEPRHLLKIASGGNLRACAEAFRCPLHDPATCFPGKSLPECFAPAGFDTPEGVEAAREVLLAWKRGTYIIVVEGDEFTL